ncbi:MAG: SPOR domain-containing protein [Bacteroidales bacterium]|nr:SPOR domain-containing protein [Bacteroidales bacterium]
MKTRIFVVAILLSITLPVTAQNSRELFSGPWSVNVNVGPNLFYGDIEVYNFFPVMHNNSEWRAAFGAMIQKKISRVVTARGQFLYGELSGTKRKYSKWFEADILETSLSATLDLSSFIWGVRDRKLSVYAMGGIGLTQWRTELKDLNTNEVIRTNGYAGGSGIGGRTVEAVLPFGMGLDYKINDNWHINLEGSLRPVNSDLLDANVGDFPFDFYSYNFVGVTYVFNKRKIMPPIELPPAEELITEQEAQQPAEEIVMEELPETEPDDILEKELRDIEDKILVDEAGKGIFEPTYAGVVFRVQVMASRDNVNPETVKNELNLKENVYLNEGNGWFRYSVGSFTKYWKAKEYKNLLVSKYNVYDAFVVAYRENERMSLTGFTGANVITDQPVAVTPGKEISFRVQLLASLSDDVDIAHLAQIYGITEDIQVEKEGKWFKYTAGSFLDFQEALKYRDQLARKGIKDAFVVAYDKQARVPLMDALR